MRGLCKIIRGQKVAENLIKKLKSRDFPSARKFCKFFLVHAQIKWCMLKVYWYVILGSDCLCVFSSLLKSINVESNLTANEKMIQEKKRSIGQR